MRISRERGEASGDGEKAAEMTFNALKLHAYWQAHDLETPEMITEALGDFLGGIRSCDHNQRSLLESHLPPEITGIVNSLLGEDGE